MPAISKVFYSYIEVHQLGWALARLWKRDSHITGPNIDWAFGPNLRLLSRDRKGLEAPSTKLKREKKHKKKVGRVGEEFSPFLLFFHMSALYHGSKCAVHGNAYPKP